MSDDEVLADAMSVLRDMFGDSVPDPVEMLMPRGEGDPLRFGSFAYWPAGYVNKAMWNVSQFLQFKPTKYNHLYVVFSFELACDISVNIFFYTDALYF